MIRSPSILTASSFLSMFFIGIGITVVGAAARNIGLEPSQIGYLITAQYLGFMVSVAIVGVLSDRYRKTVLLAWGSVVLTVSFASFYATDIFPLNLLIMASIGVGLGAYEGATDALLLDVHRGRENLFINLNHFHVSAGSVAITAYLVVLQMEWRRSMLQTGIVVAALAIVFGFSRIDNEQPNRIPINQMMRVLSRQRIMGSLFVAEMCALGLGVGTSGLLTSFLMEYRGFTQTTSKVALVIFLSGLAGGRIVSGVFAKKRHVVTMVPIMFGACLLFFSLLYFVEVPLGATYLMAVLAGLAVSPLIPLQISLAGVLFSDMPGTAMGVVKVAIPVGGIVFPFALATISDAVSFRASLILFPFIALLGLVAYLFSARAIHRRYPEG